jgi:branched-chain amino acid transport system substrate-binding protein
VRLVVGPQSSAEVRAVKPLADQQGLLVISQGSTAHSLAVPGDNLFRLCPDDEQEGPAIAALMIADGSEAIVGISRGDDGNLGLQTSTGASFTTRGGTVLDGIVYPTDQSDFGAIAADLDARVAAAIATHGADAVGVYLTAFDEAALLFAAAALITLAYLQAGGTDDIGRYKEAFTRTAETYFGVTGWTRLNAAGDRATGAFDFHGICPDNADYAWRHVGTYQPTADGTGILTVGGCPGPG